MKIMQMKTMAEEADHYLGAVYPGEITELQRRECRQAFFAGAFTLLGMMNTIGDLPEAEQEKRIGAVHDEVYAFMKATAGRKAEQIMEKVAQLPQLNMGMEHWCSRHLEPFRATWPAGMGMAMIGLLNATVRDERIQARTGGKVENLQRAFDEVKPLCCFVGDPIVHEVVQMALDGKVYGEASHP
jgi:hypothetical protein